MRNQTVAAATTRLKTLPPGVLRIGSYAAEIATSYYLVRAAFRTAATRVIELGPCAVWMEIIALCLVMVKQRYMFQNWPITIGHSLRPDAVLVHRSLRRRALAGTVLAQQEGEDDQPHRHPRQLDVNVLVPLHLRLHVQLVI